MSSLINQQLVDSRSVSGDGTGYCVMKGDHLLAQYQEVQDIYVGGGSPLAYGAMPNWYKDLACFASREDGAVVVDLWENEDGFRRMRDDREFRRNVEAADWPNEPKVEIYHVRATMQ